MKYIQKRNKSYHFRYRLSVRMSLYFPQNGCFTKSLKTENYNIAKNNAKILLQKINYIIQSIKMNIEDTKILELINDLTNTIFKETEKDLYSIKNPEDTTFALTLEDRLTSYQNAYASENYYLVENEAKKILKTLHMTYSQSVFDSICKELLNNHINNLKIIYEKIDNQDYSKPFIPSKPIPKEVTEVKKVIDIQEILTLDEAFELYKENMISTEKWNEDRDKNKIRDDETRFKFLKLFLKSKNNVKTLTVSDFNNYARVLRKLPNSFFTKNKYKSLTLSQMLKAKGDGTELSKRTVGNYVGFANRLFEFLYEKAHIDKPIIIDKIHLNNADKIASKKELYSKSELQKMYDYAVNNASEEYKWIILFAMFNGLTISEMVRLQRKNIIEIEKIWCVVIEMTEEKETKNMNRIRTVPIHPTLIEMGILDYFDKFEDKLFKVDNTIFSRDMTNINRRYVTTNKKRTFHRLRANFINTLVQNDVRAEHCAALAGHSNDFKITLNDYAGKINVRLLAKALKEIDYQF